MMRPNIAGTSRYPTDEQAGYFLLWAAIYGRRQYHGIVIDANYFDYLTTPIGAYLTRLEAFAAFQHARSTAEVGQAHAWYYANCVRDLNLEIFITGRELHTLAAMPFIDDPEGTQISLYEKVVLDVAPAARHFDLARREDRRAFKLWLAGEGGNHIPAWLELPQTENVRCRTGLNVKGASLSYGGAANGSPPPGGEGVDSARAPLDLAPVGVNVIGFAEGVLGIGEDARAIAKVLRYANAPLAVHNFALSEQYATSSDRSDLAAFFVNRPVFPINMFCVTAFDTERTRVEHGADVFVGRYNIGYWPWELTDIPRYWRQAFDCVDEIWAMSPFLVDVFSKYTQKPVVHMPPYVNVDRIEPMDRSELGFAPDDFVFLLMLDFNSYVTRKNPTGAVDAFRQAFPTHDRERLLIKTINGHVHPNQLDELLRYVDQDARIVLADGPLTRPQTCGLIAAMDCFVSLHRAEGFGRVIAEAMFLGTPVIATDWSGSTSFLDENTGFPVAFMLRDVRSGEYPYEEGSQWAEPDADDAAEKFWIVRNMPSLTATKSAAAKHRIEKHHGLPTIAQKVAERIAAIEMRMRVPGLRSCYAGDQIGHPQTDANVGMLKI